MPELPEVETIASGLRPQLEARCITDATILYERVLDGEWNTPARFLDAVRGRSIVSVGRRGKLLLLQFDDGMGLAFHLKMTGRLFVYDSTEPAHKHTRLILTLDNGMRLFFDDARKFGYARLFSSQTLCHWSFWQKLGLEPLCASTESFVAAYHGRRGRIKSLLLNQGIVVGIGNIYADEALFRAGIRPDRQADSLSPEQMATLHNCVCAVLRESIAECGSSIRDYRDAHGDAGAFQNFFRVYGRSGEQCIQCKRLLTTARVAGRTTVFCETCQL